MVHRIKPANPKGTFIIVADGLGIDLEFAKGFENAQKVKRSVDRQYPQNIVKIVPFSKKLVEHYLHEGYDVGKSSIVLKKVV